MPALQSEGSRGPSLGPAGMPQSAVSDRRRQRTKPPPPQRTAADLYDKRRYHLV